MIEQLKLDLDHEPDDLADLDLEHAENALAAERANRPLPPPPCRCLRRSMYLLDEYGYLRCAKCGRSW
jgi:hypothetical protein